MPPLWTLGVTDKNVLQRYRQTLMILIVHKNELFALEIKSSEHYFIDVIQNIYVHEPKKSEIWLLTFPIQSKSNFYILSFLRDGSKCAVKISPDTNALNLHKNELFALEIKSSEHYFINVIHNIYVH